MADTYKEFVIRRSFRNQKYASVHRIYLLLALYLRQL